MLSNRRRDITRRRDLQFSQFITHYRARLYTYPYNISRWKFARIFGSQVQQHAVHRGRTTPQAVPQCNSVKKTHTPVPPPRTPPRPGKLRDTPSVYHFVLPRVFPFDLVTPFLNTYTCVVQTFQDVFPLLD